MYHRVFVFCVVCLCVQGSVWAQRSSDDRKFITPPNEIYLLAVASQEDCPIQIENAKLLLFIGPGSNWGASYRLRNAGTKPIRIQSVTLSMWTAQGVGQSWQQLPQEADKAVLPGEVITIKEDSRRIEVVPLTDEIRDKMKLHGSLHAVVVLMVEQVKFADGSTYSAERTSKALESFFQNVDFVEYKAKDLKVP